jgi:hypothetical protein
LEDIFREFVEVVEIANERTITRQAMFFLEKVLFGKCFAKYLKNWALFSL